MSERLGKEVIVSSLEKMSDIVKNNKTLMWDGWSVVQVIPSNKARTSIHGKYLNNQWVLVKRFDPSRVGWDIPEKILGVK